MLKLLQRFGVQLQSLLQGENEVEWRKLLGLLQRAVVSSLEHAECGAAKGGQNFFSKKNLKSRRDESKTLNWNFL